MPLRVFIDDDPQTRKVHPHYLTLLFEKMGNGLLNRLPPGAEDGMFYPLHLGSPYRLSPDNSSKGNASGIFIYDFLQKDAWRKIEERGGYLLIDHIVEAFFGRQDMVRRFHEGMEIAGLKPDRVVLLNGNLLSKKRYDLLADDLGISERAHVIPYNGCFWLINAHNRAAGHDFARLEARAQRARDMIGRERAKTFVTFNGKGRPHRTYVILRMIADGYKSQGFISLLGHEAADSPSEDQIAAQIGRFPDAERLMPHIRDFLGSLPLTIDISRAGAREGLKFKLLLPWASPNPDIYDQTYFSVVLDTSFNDVGTEFHTPIAFKSFMNLSPFVYFGNYRALKGLRSIGFKTFAPFINENYDDIEDDNLRMAETYREFERLASLGHRELNSGLMDLWPALEHNYSLIHLHSTQAFVDDWNNRVTNLLPGASRLNPI
ncbi:MAG: hypothetical protein ABIO43_03650 [Sphingomicrobium sp.]